MSAPSCTQVCHNFEAAWSGTDGEGYGVIFCRACGEVRRLELAGIEAPAEESITQSDPIHWWTR